MDNDDVFGNPPTPKHLSPCVSEEDVSGGVSGVVGGGVQSDVPGSPPPMFRTRANAAGNVGNVIDDIFTGNGGGIGGIGSGIGGGFSNGISGGHSWIGNGCTLDSIGENNGTNGGMSGTGIGDVPKTEFDLQNDPESIREESWFLENVGGLENYITRNGVPRIVERVGLQNKVRGFWGRVMIFFFALRPG